MAKNRAEIEAERGIVRDEDGRILRSKEWLEARIEFLENKCEDFDRRKENAMVEIAQRKAELKES